MKKSKKPIRKLTTAKRPKRKLLATAKRPPRRRNPELAKAAQLNAKFHQRPARKVVTSTRLERYRGVTADLGALVDLVVEIKRGDRRQIAPRNNVRVTSSPDGKQLFFEGGDQALDLAALGLARWQRDHMLIGEVVSIAYRTAKGMDGFDTSRPYEHKFGEDAGVRPVLLYDALNQRLGLAGGSYRVEGRGIVN